MSAKSYSNLNNLWKASPGFATTIFVSWEDIAHVFEISDRWDLVKDDDPTPIDVINVAFHEAQEWTNKQAHNPDDKELVEIENNIAKSIMDHWSYRSVLAENINFKNMVTGINKWCVDGPKNKKLFTKTPTPQAGLNLFVNDLGINFTIYPSFIVPYTELYYKAYETLPEWNLEDLDGTDIVETLFLFCDYSGNPIKLELSQWDAKRERL